MAAASSPPDTSPDGRTGAATESIAPLRIAAHNGAPEFGGAEIATAILLAGLRARGHDVLLWTNRPVVDAGVAPYGVETRRGKLGGDIAVHHALRFALQLRRWRPDVLIVGTFRKLWLAALAARLAGVPVVARIGLSTDVPRSAKYRFVFDRWVDAVVTNADDLADAYRRALPAAPPPHIVTVHKGIEPPARTRPAAETRRALELPPDAPLIGGVGRLVEQKRFDRLLRTLARLPARVHAVVVGAGPLRPELEALAAELGVAGRVRFTGHRGDVPDLMAALDLLVVTSDRESLANVMLEALAVGTPVVSTPVSGAAEALEPEDGLPGGVPDPERVPGVVVRPEPEVLAQELESLLADPDRLAAMGRAARRAAERRFGKERMLDAWEDVLRAASRPGGPAGGPGGNGSGGRSP